MQLYIDELEIAKKLRERTGVAQTEHFICMIAECPDKYSIVYTPSGEPFDELNPNRLEQMFVCVEKLQQFGVIHRDLTPHHFLKRMKDGKEQVCVCLNIFFGL